MASNMDTVVSYAISVRLIAFGGWIVFAAATAASGLFLVWTLLANACYSGLDQSFFRNLCTQAICRIRAPVTVIWFRLAVER